LALQPGFVDLDPANQDIRRFRCGKSQMDTFLIRYAFKNAQLGISKTWEARVLILIPLLLLELYL